MAAAAPRQVTATPNVSTRDAIFSGLRGAFWQSGRVAKSNVSMAASFMRKLLGNPAAFALAVITFYLLLVLPILIRYGFDASVFIVAGDQFVDPARLASPIIVKPNSAGYDGQFYYRIALSPFEFRQQTYGVKFDNPPWRTQRIVYPLLAWAAALGRANLVPTALFLINVLGIGVIALQAVRLAARLKLPALTPLAMILWPGFVVSLTHDTTEIVAAAFVLSAAEGYLSDRIVGCAIFGCLATLTRETSILFMLGIICFEIFQAAQNRASGSRWRRLLILGLALIPFPLWREAQFFLWSHSPLMDAAKSNFDWPLMGIIEMIRDTMLGTRAYGGNLAMRAYELGCLGLLASFCALILVRLPIALASSPSGMLAAGWMPVATLMTFLSTPWIGPLAYFRAFTECFVIGCPIIAIRPPSRWVSETLFAGCVLAGIGTYVLSLHSLL